jgi:hypothetical protein
MKVALNVDGLPPVTSAEIRHVAAELAEVVEEYCSATTKVHILDAANPSFSL